MLFFEKISALLHATFMPEVAVSSSSSERAEGGLVRLKNGFRDADPAARDQF